MFLRGEKDAKHILEKKKIMGIICSALIFLIIIRPQLNDALSPSQRHSQQQQFHELPSFISSLHPVGLLTPSVGVLNIWRDIKPPDCSLWPFKIFYNQFQFFSIFFFLSCCSFLAFSFSTRQCLPISPDSVFPMFQGHTVPGEAIFCCLPANLQKNEG